MCTFQQRSLGWLDWFDKIRFIAIKDPKSQEIAPDLTRHDLLEAIHCVTEGGKIHRGARAIRFLGMRLPLLVPIGLFLWIPGVIWVAERIYKWVSDNRHLLSRVFGCKEACSIMPERSREEK